MSITTITIGANDYIAYASVAEADIYLAVDPVRSAAWTALTPDQKGINLIAATRRLDQLPWVGEKTGGAAQVNAWPRTGVSYPDGTAVSTTDVPTEVEQATIIIAGDITLSSTAAETSTPGSNIKRTKAGSAEVEFFRPTSGTLLPNLAAFNLVKAFLSANSSSLFGLSSGSTDSSVSSFSDANKYGRVEGFS